MTKFLLDTDSVLSVSKGMDTLTSNAGTVLGNVKSYDVSNNDFDFSGAKAAIVNNIEGIETKVSNTNVLLDTVVQVHTELQESVAAVADGATDATAAPAATTSSGGVTSSGGDTYSYGSTYSGSDYYTPTEEDYNNYGMGGKDSDSHWQEYYASAADTGNPANVQKLEEAKAELINRINEYFSEINI